MEEKQEFSIYFIFCQARQQIYSLQPPTARLLCCLMQEEFQTGGMIHKEASCVSCVMCLCVLVFKLTFEALFNPSHSYCQGPFPKRGAAWVPYLCTLSFLWC